MEIALDIAIGLAGASAGWAACWKLGPKVHKKRFKPTYVNNPAQNRQARAERMAWKPAHGRTL